MTPSNMMVTAGHLDWEGWLRGLAGAVISGGAGAIVTAFGVNLLDAKDWSPMQGGSMKLVELMGICFLFSAIISLAKFLQTHPIPDDLKPDTTVVITEGK